MNDSGIQDVVREFWYRTPGKDRRRSRKISAELFRYQQIEKALEVLLKNPDNPDARHTARKALKPINYDDV